MGKWHSTTRTPRRLRAATANGRNSATPKTRVKEEAGAPGDYWITETTGKKKEEPYFVSLSADQTKFKNTSKTEKVKNRS